MASTKNNTGLYSQNNDLVNRDLKSMLQKNRVLRISMMLYIMLDHTTRYRDNVHAYAFFKNFPLLISVIYSYSHGKISH
jgi:hypothetical protein